ncbi:DinB family protein [Streptomyces sp. HPF1205]|uniref:mycothiol transferase n=1 Tax=Streptomyces sp. HPF1205 TaxID=2873262 RepID=UPI001CEC8333|nr:DinB family protein [Streptomyces sp. HPF1205]
MNHAELLADAFGRVKENVHAAVDGLTPDELGERLDPGGNSVAWLIWHLTRVQDDHVAEVASRDQLWESDGWRERFDLSLPAAATGYGHTSSQVAKVRVKDASLLTGYYDAVHDATLGYVAGLSESDLDRVVDERWDPPVTLGVRLVSVIDDDIQHAGQAALLRGTLLRRR